MAEESKGVIITGKGSNKKIRITSEDIFSGDTKLVDALTHTYKFNGHTDKKN